MSIKAIETKYKGYRFRSRLEARWAVFFDALGVKWEYEKEGYDLGDAGWYLPDFWLPDKGFWVEIKPNENVSNKDMLKIQTFQEFVGKKNFYLLCGVPVTFNDDDRESRFNSHLHQMIFCVHLVDTKCEIEFIREASNTARSARFEHGETGIVRQGSKT